MVPGCWLDEWDTRWAWGPEDLPSTERSSLGLDLGGCLGSRWSGEGGKWEAGDDSGTAAPPWEGEEEEEGRSCERAAVAGKEHFAGVQKVGLKELGEGSEEEAGKVGEARRC